MKKCAFIIISDSHYYKEGAHIMTNSFKRFHPDIDLVVFRQDVIDREFVKENVNWLTAKPTFAKLLTDEYDLIVNIDADHVITGRLTEIFDNVDYDVGAPWNFNDYENASFENITEEMYLQAGIVGSTQKAFWDIWERENLNALKYLRKENDILNLVAYNHPIVKRMKVKIFDKDKEYYGCKSLGREPEFYIEDDKLMCRGEQIKAYHFARGNVFPKLDYDNMPFTDEVRRWLHKLNRGASYKAVNL